MASTLHLLTLSCALVTLTLGCGFDRFYRCDPNAWSCTNRGGYCDVRGGRCTCVSPNAGYNSGPGGPYPGGPNNGYYHNGPYGAYVEPEGNYYAQRGPINEQNIEGTGNVMVEMAKVASMIS